MSKKKNRIEDLYALSSALSGAKEIDSPTPPPSPEPTLGEEEFIDSLKAELDALGSAPLLPPRKGDPANVTGRCPITGLRAIRETPADRRALRRGLRSGRIIF